jgi:hypothetical protein
LGEDGDGNYIKYGDPYSVLAAVESLNGVRISSRNTRGKGVETHNCRTSREYGIAMASYTGTYRLVVMKHGVVDPDEVQHGGVPILQHSQARCGTRNLGRSYTNEERERYSNHMNYRFSGEAEVNLLQDLPPDQAYFTFVTVRTRYFLRERWRVPDLISKGKKVVIYP